MDKFRDYNNGVRVAVSLSLGINGRYGPIVFSKPTDRGSYDSDTWGFEGYHDTNGDGLPDAVWVFSSRSNTGVKVAVSLAEGNGRFGAIRWSVPSDKGSYGSGDWQFSRFYDVNGDSLPDAVWTSSGTIITVFELPLVFL